MAQRPLLLGLLLLLCLAVVWTLWHGDPAAAPPAGEANAAERDGEVHAVPVADAGPAPAEAADSGAARTEENMPAAGDAPPIPADAMWVDVIVIDAATREPVAGAEVDWINESLMTAMESPSTHGMMRWYEMDRIARRLGWHTRSDQDGRARVHVASAWTRVFAWQGGRYGSTFIGNEAEPPGGHRIELQPDCTLSVQVLDAEGRPAIDIPIAVSQHAADSSFLGWRPGWGPVALTEAPDGIARVAYVQQDFGQGQWQVERASEHRVRCYLPGLPDPGVAFDPESPPAETIVLQLPPCGSVRARVEHEGRLFRASPSGMSVGLELAKGSSVLQRPGDPRGGLLEPHWAQPGDDGWCRFAGVATNLSFVAHARVDGMVIRQDFAGPTVSGQEVVVAIPVPPDYMILAARVLDDRRQPLRDKLLQVELESNLRTGSSIAQTDDEGRLRFCVGRIREGRRSGPLGLTLSLSSKDAAPLRASIEAIQLQRGLLDLGDVVLGAGSLVVAGRLVHGAEPLRLRPGLQVQRLAREDEKDTWQRVQRLTITAKDDGSFEVRGEVAPGRYRLEFNEVYNHMSVEPVEFAPGTRDLLVQVDPGARLMATFLMPPDMPWGAKALLVPAAATREQAARPSGSEDRLACDIYSDNRTWRAHWAGLPPGTYSLECRLWAVREPLLTIGDIVVPPPEGGDLRLKDIDLREHIEVHTVTFVDPQGRPIRDWQQGLVVALPPDPAEWLAFPSVQGGARIPRPPGPVDLLCMVWGYRPQELRGIRGRATVTLHPWPEQILVFRDLPALPENFRLESLVQPPVGEQPRPFRSSWSSGDLVSYMRAPRQAVRVEEGRVLLPVEDGLQRLRVQLRGREGTRLLEGVTPAEFYPGPAPIEVHIPAEVLQQAIEKLTKEAQRGR